MGTLEQAVNEMRGQVMMVANNSASAMQPIEHELEDVKAAVSEMSSRVDAAVATAGADKERCDAFAHDIKKLQARASEARHMLRATEDAVREVASFVAELDERLPEGGVPAAETTDFARLSSDVAAHKKVLERLQFAVAAQDAAHSTRDSEGSVMEERLVLLREEVAKCATAASSVPLAVTAQLDSLQRSVAGLQTHMEPLPLRLEGLEQSTSAALQKASDASDAASAALAAARAVGAQQQATVQMEERQEVEEQRRQQLAAAEERLQGLQSIVSQLQRKVASLQQEQSGRVAVGKDVGGGSENGHRSANDSDSQLQGRLGRLEEATTVLSAKHQQLARQLKQQANASSQPTTPRVRPCLRYYSFFI
jgi:hypothetical protein